MVWWVNGRLAVLWGKDWTNNTIPPCVNLPLIGNYWWMIVWLRIMFGWGGGGRTHSNFSCWIFVKVIPYRAFCAVLILFQSNRADWKSSPFQFDCHPEYKLFQLEPSWWSRKYILHFHRWSWSSLIVGFTESTKDVSKCPSFYVKLKSINSQSFNFKTDEMKWLRKLMDQNIWAHITPPKLNYWDKHEQT